MTEKAAAAEAVEDAGLTQPISGTNPEEDAPMSKAEIWLLNLSTIPIMFLSLLDASIISTAVPRISAEFHSISDIGWYGAAYQLANASLQPLTGKLFTYLPLKETFLSFFVIFEIGSLICGSAQASHTLIIGRAVAGLGAAGITNGVLAMVAASVPMAQRPAIIGLGMGISQIGGLLGPLIGGFYINLPAGALCALPLFFIHIPRPAGFKINLQIALHFAWNKLDLTGLCLLAPAVIMVLMALQYGSNGHPWSGPLVIGLLSGAAVAFLIFSWTTCYKGDDAILPPRIVCKRIVLCSCLVMAFGVATTFCATFFLPVYFQTVEGASPLISGTYLLPTIVSQIIAAVTSVGKTGYYLPWSIASGALITLGSGLISTYTPETSKITWIAFQIVLGAGRGLGMQMPIIALQNYLADKDIAMGTSFLMFGHTMGAAIFLSLAQTIFLIGLRTLIPRYAPSVDPESLIHGDLNAANLTAGNRTEEAQVLLAVSRSINRVFYMTAGAGFAAFVLAFGIGWKDIRQAKR
ncbi:putative HC-toxin efflux carrier TOXA [Echria macrotheca]|uniref:HC-toxin efflux carrier TOXA n=1 Tax=Echria macrotheca TaxID=438768 RepID=A0AAJ0FD20_9PEZI|nr:putative HC-toxin efflux carrier TOXA [Echria macrotheca]